MAVCRTCGNPISGPLYDLQRLYAMTMELAAVMRIMDGLGFRFNVQDRRPRYSEDRGPVPYWDGLVERLDAHGVRPPVWKYLFTMPATTYATGATDGE